MSSTSIPKISDPVSSISSLDASIFLQAGGPAGGAGLAQPCGVPFTTTGVSLPEENPVLPWVIARKNATTLAEITCATNQNCPEPEFIKYVNSKITLVAGTPVKFIVEVTIEWKCVPKKPKKPEGDKPPLPESGKPKPQQGMPSPELT